MESKEPKPVETTEASKVEISVQPVDTAPLAKLPPANQPASQWQDYLDQVISYLSNLQDYLGDFFGKNQKLLSTVGLVVAAYITVSVTLAVLDSLNHLPLLGIFLAPFFELVGIGYSAWFAYRYLLRASTRQELSDEINGIKGQLLGDETRKV